MKCIALVLFLETLAFAKPPSMAQIETITKCAQQWQQIHDETMQFRPNVKRSMAGPRFYTYDMIRATYSLLVLRDLLLAEISLADSSNHEVLRQSRISAAHLIEVSWSYLETSLWREIDKDGISNPADDYPEGYIDRVNTALRETKAVLATLE